MTRYEAPGKSYRAAGELSKCLRDDRQMDPLGTLLSVGRRALEFPSIYRTWQSLVGADRMRRLHVRSRAEYRALADAHFSLVTDYVYDDFMRLPTSFLVMDCINIRIRIAI